MGKILIVEASIQGQTKKIAQFIGDRLSQMGYAVDLIDTEKRTPNVSLSQYRAVIVGAPVHVKGYPQSLKKWVSNHALEMEGMSTAFFSVCLGILQKDIRVQKEEQAIVDGFLKETKWHPTKTAIFAGALSYSKYNWLTRLVMKRIAGQAGGSTDTGMDHEYTDWKAVTEFAENFGISLAFSETTTIANIDKIPSIDL